MATTTFTGSLRTKKYTSSSNAKANAACQEFYDNTYNYVGIISFDGMNLANKIISAVSFTMTSAKAGFGTNHTKTVYLRRSTFQNVTMDALGSDYVSTELGTFTGSFYNNTTTCTMSGTLLSNIASYLAAGNNTFTIYNPSPSASYEGYSQNYLQWTDVTITVTYTDGMSTPTVSRTSMDLGTSVTIYTNRLNSAATHTLYYVFGNDDQTIATNVGDFYTWTPPLSLATQIPNATAGICTIYCLTYIGGSLIGTASCTVTLNVPSYITPTVSCIVGEGNSDLGGHFNCYVRTKSMLSVQITGGGNQGSTVTAYRATVNGTVYTTTSFITGYLNTAGENTLSITVTDSRGRTGTLSTTFTVVDYNQPSLTRFHAERCNNDGTAPQTDGTKVRVNIGGSVSSVNNKNTITCTVYYKLTSASAWTSAGTIAADGYTLNVTNRLLSQTFDALSSYDIKVRLQDYFYYVEQSVSIATKQVIMDILANGNGIAFGKVAEQSGHVEFGWPVILTSPLSIEQGGTGASSAALARYYLGVVSKTGDTMTGNLNIQTSLYPSIYLVPTYNGTTNRTVFEGSYIGASSFAAWEDGSGNNRRMLEVRTKGYSPSLDYAVMLRVADNGEWSNFRMFHSGMVSGIPVSNGGTGATDAATARVNLGCNNASNLTTGTVNMYRLPFKVAYGQATVNSNSNTSISYGWAGFLYVPYVIATYSQVDSGWTGAGGVLKVHSKTNQTAYITVGGSYGTSRTVDWIALGI